MHATPAVKGLNESKIEANNSSGVYIYGGKIDHHNDKYIDIHVLDICGWWFRQINNESSALVLYITGYTKQTVYWYIKGDLSPLIWYE